MVAPEFRYPNTENIPEYLRGKTAADAAQLLQGLVESVGRGQQAPPQQPVQAAADDDYVTGAQVRQVQQQALAQVNPWLQTVADQQATMGYNMVKQQHQDIFRKYEPEIIKVLGSVPKANWTLDVIQNAVTMVKGSHVDEILAERTRILESTMHSTMRSTGRAGLSPDSPIPETVGERLEKTPDAWKTHARAAGITDEQVREFCYANDITPDEFFKQFDQGLVTDSVEDVSFKRGMTG